MLKVTFFEDDPHLFSPINALKPLSDFRMGLFTIKEYYHLLIDKSSSSHSAKNTYLYINARWIAQYKDIAFLLQQNEPTLVTKEEHVLAFFTTETSTLRYEELIAQKNTNTKNMQLPDALFLHSLYDCIRDGHKIFDYHFQVLKKDLSNNSLNVTNRIIGDENLVKIGKHVNINGATLNTTNGLIFIDDEAEIMENACIRGPVYIGKKAVVKMNTSIYGSVTIGEHSVVGGEIKNAIIGNYSAKAHEGYMGDSIVGDWVNIGANTVISNLKNTAGNTPIWNDANATKDSIHQVQKIGALIGSFTKIGIGLKIFSGSVIGVGCNISDNRDIKGIIHHFSWNTEKYDFDKFIHHTKRWFELKKVNFAPELFIALKKLHNT